MKDVSRVTVTSEVHTMTTVMILLVLANVGQTLLEDSVILLGPAIMLQILTKSDTRPKTQCQHLEL